MVAEKMIATMGTGATVEATTDRARALDGADFVVTAFQIGGYRPSTVIDFDIPKQYGLRQTIADTLGVGGIMRGSDRAASLGRGRGHGRGSAPMRCSCNT
jgi:alpha-galactosidase